MQKELDLTSFSTHYRPRPHVNAFVRPHHIFTDEKRFEMAKKVGWNVFQFPSEMLMGGDLLSDSGTTALTLEQLSSLILGDEAYGSNWGYFQLIEVMEEVFGMDANEWEIYPFHQCRAAEHALFSHIKGENLIIPSNSFFDTTRANAEANGIQAIDLPASESGNMDIEALEKLMSLKVNRIPLIYMTITNNANGGQPVSMENLKATKKMCDYFEIPFFLDACRFAENAFFIKERETEYQKKSIPDIIREEFSLCDGFTISFKKDGLANMGGALAIKKDSLFAKYYPNIIDEIRDHQILVEGHTTQGGLSGREIMTIVSGLKIVTSEDYLHGRISLVRSFGSYLSSLGVPIVEPVGGHAVYIDINKFFSDTKMATKDFGGISLTGLLLIKGVRLCELGAFAFGKYNPETEEEIFPDHNYVRAAVPRNKYEKDDLFYVADCIKALHNRGDEIPKAVAVYGKEKTLRHFKARFELVF